MTTTTGRTEARPREGPPRHEAAPPAGRVQPAWFGRLFDPVDIASLVVFRIAFGG